MAKPQAIPLHRVQLALGFTVRNLQLKPLCGWACRIEQWRFAFARPFKGGAA